MSENPDNHKPAKSQKELAREAAEARKAQALRDNLRRRKAAIRKSKS